MDNSCLTHSRAITSINDNIHGINSLSCFEREIVDSKYFQRLHFVLQNSTAYVAFPSNKNTRFSHSLGVAKVSGDLFVNALSQSSSCDLRKFLKDAAKFILTNFVNVQEEDYLIRLRSGWKQTISGQSKFRHSPFLKTTNKPIGKIKKEKKLKKVLPVGLKEKFEGMTAGFLVDTLWETIRICGLVHDIGHLPMSHSFEGALDRLNRRDKHENINTPDVGAASNRDGPTINVDAHIDNDKFERLFGKYSNLFRNVYHDTYDQEAFLSNLKDFPLHERRSLLILDLLFGSGLYSFKSDTAEYRRIIYLFVTVILFSSMKKDSNGEADEQSLSSFFRMLKSVVAGAVDGDRLDYTLRDGASSASKVGSFDINDILTNAVLFRNKEEGKSVFRLCFYHKALPAIEQFFTQRHQGYKYLIYHRTSSRSEACLQELIALLYRFSFEFPDHRITQLLVDHGYLARQSSGNSFTILPTEGWQLVSVDDANLRTLLSKIEYICQQQRGASKTSKAMKALLPFLSVFLYRDFRHIYDPFKYSSMKSRLLKVLQGSNCEFNGFDDIVSTVLDDEVREGIFARIEARAAAVFKEKATIILDLQKPKIFHSATAASKDEDVFLLYGIQGRSKKVRAVRAAQRSHILSNMHKLYGEEVKINCYFVGDNLRKKPKLLNKINRFIDAQLVEQYKEILKHAATLPN